MIIILSKSGHTLLLSDHGQGGDKGNSGHFIKIYSGHKDGRVGRRRGLKAGGCNSVALVQLG